MLEQRSVCEVDVWDQGTFEPSGYTLDSLLNTAKRADFAVLVASPDDVTKSRGAEEPSVRDNIVLEFGLFIGAIGRERTYLLATGPAKLPTDTLGLTRLPYRRRSDGNERAAVNDAALQVALQVELLGRRERDGAAPRFGSGTEDSLAREISRLCLNAEAQGWTIKTNSETTLRLRSPQGKVLAMSKGRPEQARNDLRTFANRLRAAGLRVNSGIRRRVEDSPF